jgi:3',5'-cyclic AMP phosphodiesterase CpdA
VKFAVIGDSGTGKPEQYDLARQMENARAEFPFTFVLMMGDNIYGFDNGTGLKTKFEMPYKALLDGGVKFYASLGNHDDRSEIFYKPFGMSGNRYYTFKRGDVQFLALDSNYLDPDQLEWLKTELKNSRAKWRICFFHHPLYSHARYHGPDADLRAQVEPVFAQFGVNVVLSGHEHVYERLKPIKGIHYIVLGNSGQLRPHDLAPSPETAKGFDTDRTFMLVEIQGNELSFQTISRNGDTVDAGVIQANPSRATIDSSAAR